ncbi:MAG: hypothetical protein NTV97_12340 [Alphaproteobacteria bacterium]|nr:hypothetical protein [Alphaproteobacteria bacterium]
MTSTIKFALTGLTAALLMSSASASAQPPRFISPHVFAAPMAQPQIQQQQLQSTMPDLRAQPLPQAVPAPRAAQPAQTR